MKFVRDLKSFLLKRLALMAALMLLLLFILAGCGPIPGGYEDVEVPLGDFVSLLTWLSDIRGGAMISVMFLVAWTLEYWDKWHDLSAGLKRGIVGAFVVLVALGAQWLLGQPDLLAKIEPVTTPIFYAINLWLLTQVAHMLNGLRKKAIIEITSEELIE